MNETTTQQVLDDRYVLLDQLGSGGAGAVWRAHDEVLDRTVAVKLLHGELARDGETAARFRAEAAAAAKLTHPNAVIVYDIGTIDNCDYLVMELVEGGTLADVLDQGPLPAGVAAAVGAQIGRALGTAHGRGLVHRDVKPANVLITRDGVAKVADFGIARALGESTSRLTTPGHVVGTARYLAPEQLRDQEIDGRADVYAVGLMLHQAVTGALPFGEGTAAEVAARRLVADGLPRASEIAPGVPGALDDVIARATAIDPDDRYVDGAALAAALGPLAAPQAATELAARLRRVPRDLVHAEAPITPRTNSRQRDTLVPPRATDPDATVPAHAVAEPTGQLGAEPQQNTRRPWLAWAAALAVLLLGLWFVWPDAPAGDATGDADARQAPTEQDAAETAPLDIADVGDHDPPPGRGSENPDELDNATDDDPSTAWQTEGYDNDPALGGLKPGVGMWLDLGETQSLDEVTLTTQHPGYDLRVFVGDAPPSQNQSPEDWGADVGGIDDAAEQEVIDLADGTEGRTVLLWFTTLGPEDDRFRGSVAEVEVHGS